MSLSRFGKLANQLQQQVQQSLQKPPTGGPPQQGYEQTGAGYNPGYQQQQGQQPPYPSGGYQTQQQQEGAQGGAEQGFQYSRCNGRRKALLVGINYFGQSGQLGGCINDVHNVHRFIMDRFGYRQEDIVILTDDSQDERTMPTKANIVRGMQWLVDGAQRDDALFFHYSGHGTQQADQDGDEGDDGDEAICPLDYERAGLIIDDDSDHALLVRPLPAGARLTAIFDSCHSGTVMDLPYIYSTEGKIKGPDYFDKDAQKNLMGAARSFAMGNTAGGVTGLFGAAKGAFGAKTAYTKTQKLRESPADVIMWSGCKDSQTSADTQEEGKATGAMSYAFISSLTKFPDQSYQQLLNTVRDEMKGKYSQKPQLSACHPIDVSLKFVA